MESVLRLVYVIAMRMIMKPAHISRQEGLILESFSRAELSRI